MRERVKSMSMQTKMDSLKIDSYHLSVRFFARKVEIDLQSVLFTLINPQKPLLTARYSLSQRASVVRRRTINQFSIDSKRVSSTGATSERLLICHPRSVGNIDKLIAGRQVTATDGLRSNYLARGGVGVDCCKLAVLSAELASKLTDYSRDDLFVPHSCCQSLSLIFPVCLCVCLSPDWVSC